MDITQTPPPPAFSGGQAANIPDTPSTVIGADFEMFLRMLTVQMTNQDPLNPIDSADYAVQLATFSGVEQQVQTNTLLSNLAGLLGGNDMSQMARWIGLEAQVGASMPFDGTPLSLTVSKDARADQVVLQVRNAQGDTVERLPVSLTATEILWDGLDSNGDPYAPGNYQFEIQSFVGGSLIGQRSAKPFSSVVEVQQHGTQTSLVLSSGAVVTPDQITSVRDPLHV